MTTKPATPLPWRPGFVTGKRHHEYYVANTEHANVIDSGAVNADDAEYIVEACNAYPRLLAERAELIEALRRAVAAHCGIARPLQMYCSTCTPAEEILSRLESA